MNGGTLLLSLSYTHAHLSCNLSLKKDAGDFFISSRPVNSDPISAHHFRRARGQNRTSFSINLSHTQHTQNSPSTFKLTMMTSFVFLITVQTTLDISRDWLQSFERTVKIKDMHSAQKLVISVLFVIWNFDRIFRYKIIIFVI
jgi:hypothetical protein